MVHCDMGALEEGVAKAMVKALTKFVPAGLMIALLICATTGRAMADERYSQVEEATDWGVYGADYAHETDDAVPGRTIVSARTCPQATEAWSCSAAVPIAAPLTAGKQVTIVFWARAAHPLRLTANLQAKASPYARFASVEVALTDKWQRVSFSAVVPTDMAANTQVLAVLLGHAGADVHLGPVAVLHGKPGPVTVENAFANFQPSEVAVDVRIPAEPGVVLAGTLHLPVLRERAPIPLAIFIQGHGPNGRGGFPLIIKRLTSKGIAALEYDKRGIGQSTGRYQESLDRLTADAAAAVAAMRNRPDIDARRIALIGHSQGGVIAPAVAAADPGIATVVMLAGSVGDGLPYLRRALTRQMILAGCPQAKVAPAVDSVIALVQARIDGRSDAEVDPLRADLVSRFEAAGFPHAQALSALAMIDTEEAATANRLHSASDLRALHQPVLAVFGSKDPLVVASEEAAEARSALANNPQGKVVVIDGLSHWFQEGAVSGNEEEVSGLGPNAGSPRLIELVDDWLERVFRAIPGET